MKKSIVYTMISLIALVVIGMIFNDLLVGAGSGIGVAMALTGYTRVCGLQSGGGKKLYLAEVASVTCMTVTSGVYTAITMNGVAVFKQYEFEPDSFEVKENSTIENGSLKVTHEIEFYLKKMSDTSRTVVSEIATASACGLIAIAEDNNGTKWVVGYSENHGKLRPLTLSSAEVATGKKLNDAAGTTLKLTSEDNENMHTVTTSIPV